MGKRRRTASQSSAGGTPDPVVKREQSEHTAPTTVDLSKQHVYLVRKPKSFTVDRLANADIRFAKSKTVRRPDGLL